MAQRTYSNVPERAMTMESVNYKHTHAGGACFRNRWISWVKITADPISLSRYLKWECEFQLEASQKALGAGDDA